MLVFENRKKVKITPPFSLSLVLFVFPCFIRYPLFYLLSLVLFVFTCLICYPLFYSLSLVLFVIPCFICYISLLLSIFSTFSLCLSTPFSISPLLHLLHFFTLFLYPFLYLSFSPSPQLFHYVSLPILYLFCISFHLPHFFILSLSLFLSLSLSISQLFDW